MTIKLLTLFLSFSSCSDCKKSLNPELLNEGYLVISNDTLRGAVKCADLRVVHPLHDKLLCLVFSLRLPSCHQRPKTLDGPLRSAPTYGADVMQKCSSHLFLLVDIEELVVERVRQLRALQLKKTS